MELLLKYAEHALKVDTGIQTLNFRRPQESRFKDLFLDIKSRNKKRKTMLVYPKNVMLGSDKRTSIIIKNIPDNLSSVEFQKILFSFSNNIDFFYVPINIKTRKKLRVAFVNVLDYKELVPIYMGLIYRMKFQYNNPTIKMEICYSKVQGRMQLIQRFLNELLINKINCFNRLANQF